MSILKDIKWPEPSIPISEERKIQLQREIETAFYNMVRIIEVDSPYFSIDLEEQPFGV